MNVKAQRSNLPMFFLPKYIVNKWSRTAYKSYTYIANTHGHSHTVNFGKIIESIIYLWEFDLWDNPIKAVTRHQLFNETPNSAKIIPNNQSISLFYSHLTLITCFITIWVNSVYLFTIRIFMQHRLGKYPITYRVDSLKLPQTNLTYSKLQR